MKIAKSNSGMSLLEILLASTILSGVIAMSFSIVSSSQGAIISGSIKGAMEDKARFVIDNIANELRLAGKTSLDPATVGVENYNMRFRKLIDFQAGANVFSDVIEYTLEAEDPVNGVDDNNNGLIDEQMLMKITRDPVTLVEKSRVAIAKRVKANGLIFVRTQQVGVSGATEKMAIELTLQNIINNNIVEVSYKSEVIMRNP